MLIRRGKGAWVPAEQLRYASEDELQALVSETFEQILQVQTDAPAIVAREVAMPDRGRVDVLAVDADAFITVCECKLASNPSSRREVLGQVLEYAAWLTSLSVRQFRAAVEARIGVDLLEAMTLRVGEEWDQASWLEEIDHTLRSGEFRLLIAVDEVTATLKQTVQYLNEHSTSAVIAVEMRRGGLADIEVLSPTLFGSEEAQRKAPTPSREAIQNADTVIVAATSALPEYEHLGFYICQPYRSFRPETRYLGFYSRREIAPMFPRIVTRRQGVKYAHATVEELRASGDPEDGQVAEALNRALGEESPRKVGEEYQIVVLDPDAGFVLSGPVRHESGGAWTQGQRYTSSEALKRDPATTEDLRAAGG